MERRLNSRCKGLLEVAYNSTNEPTSTISITSQPDMLRHVKQTVEYIHRTAKGFIEKPDVWSAIKENSEASFDPYESLCRATVFRLKHVSNGWWFQVWPLVQSCLVYAKSPTSKVNSRLLDELDSVASQLYKQSSEFKSDIDYKSHWAETCP